MSDDTDATTSRSTGLVLVERDERIATVTLNRPDQRNALSRALQARITEVLVELDADDEVDVIILTGADPAFCAGVDLKELGSGPTGTEGDSGADLVLPKEFSRGPLPDHVKPVIGAVNGPAVTGGFELALACDFLVASERARFADTHARVGIMPGWGLTVLLPEAVGVRRAREMSTTGNYIDAEVAAAWGLVNHVVPHDDLLPFCRQLARDIASNDQAGVRQMLDTYQRGAGTTADEAWGIEAEVSRAWIRGLDPAEVEARRLAIVERGRSQQT
ncbi:MAG: enoyl-CoA hydratase [Acidimicrobiales bacterium]